MLDMSLFPANEEWGTGDEAMDGKLSVALKNASTSLSFESISAFYFLGQSLKVRTYNPSFMVTIELVTKALFYLLDPNECVDHSIKKMKGKYFIKEKINFKLEEVQLLLNELRLNRKYRYHGQIDFSINIQDPSERNPFVRAELKRSAMDLNSKIIFKEFKSYLLEEHKAELFIEPLFQALRGGKYVLFIENFAEIWFDQDQIFGISLMNLNYPLIHN